MLDLEIHKTKVLFSQKIIVNSWSVFVMDPVCFGSPDLGPSADIISNNTH